MGAVKKFLCHALPSVSVLALCASVGLGAPAPESPSAERWTALAERVFHHVARERELPNLAIPQTLTQDAEGFTWVGTQDGLARWDGYHFRVYKSDPASEEALPDNYIDKLYTDSRGRLWIGTLGGGLARYDKDHDRFVRYAVGPSGLSGVTVWDIADDGAGGVWLATDGGLDHLPAEAGRVSHLRLNEREPGSVSNRNVFAVQRTPDGTLWVGSAAGLVRRGRGDRAFVPVVLVTPDGKAALVKTLFEDTSQRLWIGTQDRGAYVLDPKDMRARQVLESNSQQSTLATETIFAFVEARPGEVWIGTHHGIFAVGSPDLRVRRIQHDPLVQYSLADDSVAALYKDRSGLVWICTQQAISLYDPSQDAIYAIAGASGHPGGLSDHDVLAVLPMPDGSIWLGNRWNGIDIVDPGGVRTAAGLRPNPARPQTALPRSGIRAFARAESQDVYVGTGQGLYRVDALARSATRVTLTGRDPGAVVRALLLRNGVLWVGGYDGLWELDTASSKGTAHTPLPASRVEGLSDPRVSVIQQGPEGALWIGTYHGLNRLDPASGALERILPDARDPGALASGYVQTLLTDQRGRLWVGTGRGIDVLEGRAHDGRPRFHHLGVAQGLANEDIAMLLPDLHGEIWASTDDGVALIDPASFKIRTLRRAEGVAFPGNWLGAGAVTGAGELVFSGQGGLTVVRPDRLKHWGYQPPVVVTDVRIGGKWVPSSYLNLGGRGHEPLTIAPEANSMAVEFAALDYSAPELNRYAYKLEGFDKDWTETNSDLRLAAYTNLPPGDYLLRLRGSNRDGVWSDALTVPVRVLPAWFQTLTFRVLVSFVVLGLLAFVYRLRIRYIAERLKERHRARLAERDRIARELHDTLLQSTEGLILKVHSAVSQLSPEEPQRALLGAALDRASELAYEGRERIQGLREDARPRAEIGQVLEKTAREMVRGSALRFELKLEGRVRELRPYIWEELYRVAYEALWNAYRHARASLITVSVNYGDRELHIMIGDDGCGIAPGILQSALAGGHFGLAGMQERARGMAARLHIESSEGYGTRVEIRISCRRAYAA